MNGTNTLQTISKKVQSEKTVQANTAREKVTREKTTRANTAQEKVTQEKVNLQKSKNFQKSKKSRKSQSKSTNQGSQGEIIPKQEKIPSAKTSAEASSAELNYFYDKSFVENNLIAYIGNKRRLLPLLISALREIENYGSTKINRSGVFIDYFSGTGVVSRLAKFLGFSVVANDWEHYSQIINQAFLLNDEDILKDFDNEGGIEKVLKELNGLVEKKGKGYIADYYCPSDSSCIDTKNERMFYTRQNGILIDNIRREIDNRYKECENCGKTKNTKNTKDSKIARKIARKKNLLLALLLVQCSKRSNTSGVFKAFHQGFGGRNGDALSRILHPISLEKPVLTKDGGKRARVYRLDALKLSEKMKDEKAEIAYLDPPYNQHQYGSNYHLLNTIALNDKPAIKKSFWVDGKKVDKGGIRKDWVLTKSSFCYKSSACRDFKSLVEKINAKYIVVSYSTEGIIDFEDILKTLACKGKVAIVTQGYTRFRGGRQCNTTKKKNIEFVLIVDTNLPCLDEDLENVRGIVALSHIQLAFEEPLIILENKNQKYYVDYSKDVEKFFLYCVEENIALPLDDRLCLTHKGLSKISTLSLQNRISLIKNLEKIANRPSHEKVIAIANILKKSSRKKYGKVEKNYLFKEFVRLAGKINPQKTPIIYQEVLDDLSLLGKELGKEFLNYFVSAKSKIKNFTG